MTEHDLQTVERLTQEFAIPGVLSFADRGDLVCAEVTTSAARASIALQGAHVLEWTPAGQEPALFLSERSEFKPGKAVRGGVPVIWPWFGARSEVVTDVPAAAPKSPSHGFARTSPWQLGFAALAGEELHLSLTLGPSDESRTLGFDRFRLAYQIVIGRTLSLRFTVANDGPEPLRFEEALHSYLAVGDIEQVTIHGLEAADYLDKTEGMAHKPRSEELLRMSGSTDRVYLATGQSVLVEDAALGRSLLIEKSRSQNTVIWNPWAALTAGLPDMAPEGWQRMLCVETANVGTEAITLPPGEAHTMSATLSVQPHQTNLPAGEGITT